MRVWVLKLFALASSGIASGQTTADRFGLAVVEPGPFLSGLGIKQ
jgi:hypothetical protein